MKYHQDAIEERCQKSLDDAHQALASLSVAEGRKPSINALNGRVYEQTIQYCLSQELKALGLSPNMAEQVSLSGRAKLDLLVGEAASVVTPTNIVGIELRSKKGDGSIFI